MGTFKGFKNALGFASEDDKVKGDSAMAADARAKAIRAYDKRSMLEPALQSARPSDAAYRTEMGAKAAREADAEVKREMRGIQKTETDRAREEADEMSLQRKTDKAYNDSTKGMAKGGMTASARADGIAQRGKTRGKVC